MPKDARSIDLEFDMIANDWSVLGAIVVSPGLDFASGPNQNVRADILSNGSHPFDIWAGMVKNIYLGIDKHLARRIARAWCPAHQSASFLWRSGNNVGESQIVK